MIQDQVANHTGPYHPWVADPPTPTWFHGTAERHPKNVWQTWTIADPHATPDIQRETLDGWFIDILPDLNQDDPDVSRYLVQNALWWVGITGPGRDPPGHAALRARGASGRSGARPSIASTRSCTLLGEMFDGDPALVSYFQGGAVRDGIDSGIDTLFDFPSFYPIRRAFAEGKPLRELAVMLAHDRLYPDASVLVTLSGLHDTGRFMNEPGATVGGPPARGHVPPHRARHAPRLLRRRDRAARRRRPGQPARLSRRLPRAIARNAFITGGRTAEEAAVFDNLRRLAWLRAELAPLRRGRMVTLAVTEQAWAYARVLGDQAVVVVLNNAAEPVSLDIPTAAAGWTADRAARRPARRRLRARRRRASARVAGPALGRDLYRPLDRPGALLRAHLAIPGGSPEAMTEVCARYQSRKPLPST